MDARPRVTHPDVVDQDTDLDTASAGIGERVDELRSHARGFEDIAHERNRFLRFTHCGDHRRIGFIAIDQEIEVIAHQQGPLGDSRHDARKLDQARSAASELPIQIRRRAWRLVQRNAVVGGACLEPLRTPLDSIDAEKDVEDRAYEWNEPNQRNPGRCRAGVTLVQYDVRRRREREEDVQRDAQLRREFLHLRPVEHHRSPSSEIRAYQSGGRLRSGVH